MFQPLVTQDQVINALKARMLAKWNIPFFLEYPKDPDKVRFGIYVSEVIVANRNPYALAVNYGGNIYHAVDQVTIVYVSFQDDPYAIQVNEQIADMLGDNVLFNGYHQRDHDQALVYGNNLEKYTWTYSLTRLEFQ